MHKKLSFTNGRGDTLVGILHDPIGNQTTKPPVMLLCHGFGSDKDRITYLTLETLLAERGIAVFRFDFYGHGESEGDISDITISEGIDDAIHAYDLLLEQGYTKIGLFGSSFGGCVALHIAAKLNEKLEILGL